MQKPTLYLFVGYPGAGKTTAAHLIKEKTGGVHLWADYERQRMFGVPIYTEEENNKLYAYLNNLTFDLLKSGKCVIFDTNFNFLKDRQHLRDIARAANANAFVIWINTPKELAKKRAVEQSENQRTRIYGNMSEADFDRIATHLEAPDENEDVIKIDGSRLNSQELLERLKLA